MMPINFDESNCIVEIPEPNGTGLNYTEYAGYKFQNELGTQCLVTCWRPNKEDLEAIIAGKPICLLQMGDGFNRIHLYTQDGF